MTTSRKPLKSSGSNDPLPIPGLTPLQVKKLSRQQRYKLRRQADGLCVACGRNPINPDESQTLCRECRAKQRERMRTKIGASRRNVNSPSYA
jgi:hypothetical protein